MCVCAKNRTLLYSIAGANSYYSLGINFLRHYHIDVSISHTIEFLYMYHRSGNYFFCVRNLCVFNFCHLYKKLAKKILTA